MKVPFEELKSVLKQVLLKNSFSGSKAEICSDIFASNSRDGVSSHGLNRFPVFIDYVKKGLINIEAEPKLESAHGSVEIYDGLTGPGMYNCTLGMARAIDIAKNSGIGCVVMKNNNHWMRGGTYGWQAAEAGCIGICFTNAIAGMPPWGGKEARLGNNPLVIAVPRKEGHIVLDIAMSQFSYGKMQEYEWSNTELPFPGGFDEDGALTKDPVVIRKNKSALPIGLWKGSGLALVFDIVLAALGGGRSTADITRSGNEIGLSQCLICINQENLHPEQINDIIRYTQSSAPLRSGDTIRYPGENTLKTSNKNLKEGIPVNEEVWEKVKNMR